MKITRVLAREIFDSLGNPTVQCELQLENGVSVFSSVPSGKSKSIYEAHELRDGGNRLMGRGVSKAIENIEMKISSILLGQEPNPLEMDLQMIDLDNTNDKSNLGANAMLAVSIANYRALAACENLELYELIAHICGAETVTMPYPMFNIINGGCHAENKLNFQEFIIIPTGTSNFRNSLEVGIIVHQELAKTLKKHNKIILFGDEGGFAPLNTSDREALDILIETLYVVNSNYGFKCLIVLDAAASQWYNNKTELYTLHGKNYSCQELINWYKELTEDYPIYAIEDGLSQDDWKGWNLLAQTMQNKIQLIGDDIFATNPIRISQGIEQHLTNAIIIKPNQIGTVTETLQAITLCKKNNIATIISHRSAETEDTFIADLAVATSAGQIKAGSPYHTEHLIKYNRLLTIEDALALSILDS